MMNVIACMIAFNGEPYIRYAIEGILPHVDKLVIVYGAQKEFANQEPDNTLNICMEYSRERSDKIFLLTGNFDNEADQRNSYLEYIRKELDCDWLWVVDTDEFYKPQHVEILKDIADVYYDCNALLYPFWNFYGRIPEGFNYYNINEIGMLKFIKWNNDLKYHHRKGNAQVLDNIGNNKYHTLWEKRDKLCRVDQGTVCFHYGHAASEENYLQKLVSSCLRDHTNPKKKHLKMATQKFREDWVRRNYPWFSDNWIDKMNLQEFKGEHPKQIKKLMEVNKWI